jgi:hypothetical protein
VTAGLDAPEPGFKAEDGRIAATSWPEKAEAGLVSQEEYAAIMAGETETGLNRRLALLNTEEAKAMAEVDSEYAALRREKLLALRSVKKQAGGRLPWFGRRNSGLQSQPQGNPYPAGRPGGGAC